MDTEAQLSGDEEGGSDDEAGEGLDAYESDFIDDNSQNPTGGSAGDGGGDRVDGSDEGRDYATPRDHASLVAFHHRRLHENQYSPSPGEYLRRLHCARLGRHGRVDNSDVTPLGTAGAAGMYPLGSDDYDREDSFIDDGAEDSLSDGEPGVMYDTPAGRDSHSDACGGCGRGDGELLLCDACPAVFHLSCVGLREVPLGDWYCPVCTDAMSPDVAGAAGGKVAPTIRPPPRQPPQQRPRQQNPAPLPLQRVQPPAPKQQVKAPPKPKPAAAVAPRKPTVLDDSDDDFA